MDQLANNANSSSTSKKRTLLVGVIALIVILIFLGVLISRRQKQSSSTGDVKPLPQEVEVQVTDEGFVPDSVTIAAGVAVRWVNKTDGAVTVNSDDHPTHQKFKELNLGEFGENSTVVHIFTTKGTFTYHDHLHPDNKGSITVQ